MSMVKLTIDGKQVVTETNTTLLQAARSAGIQIPTLCYHERLNPIGSCRLCVVEVSGSAEPVQACETPVAEVWWLSPSRTVCWPCAKKHWSAFWFIIRWIVPSATKAGECKLQDLVFEFGIKAKVYQPPRSHTMSLTRRI